MRQDNCLNPCTSCIDDGHLLRLPVVETESRVCTVRPATFQPVTCPFRAPTVQELLTCFILLCLPLTEAFCRLKLSTQSNAPACLLCVITSAKDFMFSASFVWFSVSTVTQNYWMKLGERIGHRLRQMSWNGEMKGADPVVSFCNIAAFFNVFINFPQNNVWFWF